VKNEPSLQPILLVDGHRDSRVIYRTILEHAGYAVCEAGTGDEGVGQARMRLPRAILLELVLPRLDGLDLLRTLRSDPVTARIPRIVLTSCEELRARRDSIAAGADGYLLKPCNPAALLREVAAQLERGAARRGTPAGIPAGIPERAETFDRPRMPVLPAG
jgi:DNA-binding response OmpR family regulator